MASRLSVSVGPYLWRPRLGRPGKNTLRYQRVYTYENRCLAYVSSSRKPDVHERQRLKEWLVNG